MRRSLVMPVAALLSLLARHAQATFPFPPPPSGTPPQNYAAQLRLPIVSGRNDDAAKLTERLPPT